MTRDEHLAWAKQRALDLVDREPINAMASLVSDLKKHSDLARHPGIEIGAMLMLGGHLSSSHKVRKFINGFN